MHTPQCTTFSRLIQYDHFVCYICVYICILESFVGCVFGKQTNKQHTHIMRFTIRVTSPTAAALRRWIIHSGRRAPIPAQTVDHPRHHTWQQQQHTAMRALYSSDSTATTHEEDGRFPFSENEYFRAINETMDHIVEVLEPILEEWEMEEENSGCDDIEVDNLGDGVVNVRLGENVGTFVISRQTPSRQLWLSSPVSGPWHYNYDHLTGRWLCTKGGAPFWELMERELSEVLKRGVKFT